jgi:hypothetical protein
MGRGARQRLAPLPISTLSRPIRIYQGFFGKFVVDKPQVPCYGVGHFPYGNMGAHVATLAGRRARYRGDQSLGRSLQPAHA